MSILSDGKFSSFEAISQPELFFHFCLFALFVAVSVLNCLQFFGEFWNTAHVSPDIQLAKVINLMQLEPGIN
jgi:hypothetical protein